MTNKSYVKICLIAGLLALSLGGWILHTRVHPVVKNPANVIPVISALFGIFAIPAMFWFRRTFHAAYILNGMFVILGSITMAHFSYVHPPTPLSAYNLIMKTTLPDILILVSKLFTGMALLRLEFFPSGAATTGKIGRYPTLGWWTVHAAGIALVYALGAAIWR